MSSKKSAVDFILEQISNAGSISAKKMFGEYALYCHQKVVALVCDGQLFIKPTVSGRALLSECVEEPPYPGAKPWFLISGDLWEDGDWLTKLIQVTTAELPLPKPKSKRRKNKITPLDQA